MAGKKSVDMISRRSLLMQDIENIFTDWEQKANEMEKENNALSATYVIKRMRAEVLGAVASYEKSYGGEFRKQ